MGQQFDELSKALASGMSRRTSLKRFAIGAAGAALASVVPGRVAKGAPINGQYCVETCRELGYKWAALARCAAACGSCEARGGVFAVMNEGAVCLDA